MNHSDLPQSDTVIRVLTIVFTIMKESEFGEHTPIVHTKFA